jgi:hypothetical protein
MCIGMEAMLVRSWSTLFVVGAMAAGVACGSGPDSSFADERDGTEAPDLSASPNLGSAPGASGDGTASGNVCEELAVPANVVPPDVLVLVDRSGSMAGERWNVTSSAVVGAVAQTEGKARFGLAMFPSVGEELACLGGRITVQPGATTAKAIAEQIQAPAATVRADNGYTPTRATLAIATQWASTRDAAARAGYALLVTDGKPNCPVTGDKASADEGPTYAALEALKAKGVRTFVVGYLTNDVATVMDEMARRGGTGHHYPVKNAADLSAALASISATVGSCTFQLAKAPPGAAYVRVSIEGQRVDADESNGWALDGPTALSLRGAACDRFRTAGGTVRIVVACEAEAPK